MSVGLLNDTRQLNVLPDVVDTIAATATSATIDITSCGDTTGGRDLRGRWVYFYGNGDTFTLLRGTHTVSSLAGIVVTSGGSTRLFFPWGTTTNETTLSIITATGAASITFAYDSNGGAYP